MLTASETKRHPLLMAFEKNASLAKELMKSAISGFGQLPAEQRADVAWIFAISTDFWWMLLVKR